MFERFTDRARRVLVLAQEEARLLEHNFIGTEHLLLGLSREGEGIAAKALAQLGVQLEALRVEIERIVPKGGLVGGSPPFTPRTKKVLELSLREALRLGHNYIGTEHLLLSLVREGEGAGAHALEAMGVKLPDVREQVLKQLKGYESSRTPEYSPAVTLVLANARRQAKDETATTSHVLRSILEVPDSQGAMALGRLGITIDKLEEQVAAIPLEQTSDCPPGSGKVQIKLGDTTTTIADPELAAALRRSSPERIRAALRQLLTGRVQEAPPVGDEEGKPGPEADEPPSGEADG